MRSGKPWVVVLIATAAFWCASAASAGDFDWMRDFNIRAEADPAGFRAELATRFNVGPTEVDAVIGNMGRPADAYMAFRLGEMSHRPPEYVVRRYHSEKGKGWGALAKSMGIKPGSQEFHALKRGDDLHGGHGKAKHKGKDKDKKHKGKDWKYEDKDFKGSGKGKD